MAESGSGWFGLFFICFTKYCILWNILLRMEFYLGMMETALPGYDGGCSTWEVEAVLPEYDGDCSTWVGWRLLYLGRMEAVLLG